MDSSAYVAIINPNYIISENPEFTTDQLRQKVTQCFQKTGPLHSWNGETLLLAIASKNKAIATYMNKIKIDTTFNKNHHTNALEYKVSEFNDCPTLIHETLHLLGIWDEYDGALSSQRTKLCRAISNSIMGNLDYKAMTSKGLLRKTQSYITQLQERNTLIKLKDEFISNPSKIYVFLDRITCNGNHLQRSYDSKKGLIDLITGQTSEGTQKNLLVAPLEDLNFVTRTGNNSSQNNQGSIKVTPYLKKLMNLSNTENITCAFNLNSPLNDNLIRARTLTNAYINQILNSKHEKDEFPLRPAHFRKILYPGCFSKNKNYNMCTLQAYEIYDPRFCIVDQTPICQSENWLD